jgi:2-dehydro-3-deoxygluconokinase
MLVFPSIKKVFDKTRTSLNSSWHKIHSSMRNGIEFGETEDLDRIGARDAYAVGLIYALQNLG